MSAQSDKTPVKEKTLVIDKPSQPSFDKAENKKQKSDAFHPSKINYAKTLSQCLKQQKAFPWEKIKQAIVVLQSSDKDQSVDPEPMQAMSDQAIQELEDSVIGGIALERRYLRILDSHLRILRKYPDNPSAVDVLARLTQRQQKCLGVLKQHEQALIFLVDARRAYQQHQEKQQHRKMGEVSNTETSEEKEKEKEAALAVPVQMTSDQLLLAILKKPYRHRSGAEDFWGTEPDVEGEVDREAEENTESGTPHKKTENTDNIPVNTTTPGLWQQWLKLLSAFWDRFLIGIGWRKSVKASASVSGKTSVSKIAAQTKQAAQEPPALPIFVIGDDEEDDGIESEDSDVERTHSKPAASMPVSQLVARTLDEVLHPDASGSPLKKDNLEDRVITDVEEPAHLKADMSCFV